MQNQTILVIYQGETFAVDYLKLYESSNKFREMMKTYLDSGVDPQMLQLKILYDKFTSRNISNFLKMIQNKKNDVHSQEIVEICKIAKLFQAEKLYDKSLSYVHNRIDPNFTVSEDFDELNGEKYLELEYVNDSNTQDSYNNEFTAQNDTNPSINETSTINYTNDQEDMTPAREKLPNICYRIQIFNPPLKCCRYYFKKEGRIILTGKKKSNEIYIGHGNDIHISSSEKEICGRIMQCDGHNIAYVNGQEIRLTYVPYFVRNQFSLTTSFVIGGETVTWSPRTIDSALSGEFNRPSIQSKRNMILKNQDGEPVFFVRKVENDVFEVESLPTIDPLIVFVIGVSQIVGPFT